MNTSHILDDKRVAINLPGQSKTQLLPQNLHHDHDVLLQLGNYAYITKNLSTAVLVELRNEAKNLKDEPIAKEKPQYHISCQQQVNRTIRNVKSGSSGNNTLTQRKRLIFWTQQAAVLKDPAAFPSTLTPFALSLSLSALLFLYFSFKLLLC